MTRTVMTEFLISIASNYWESQFANDFPGVAAGGFQHAGKFGIGFLSVFMLGDQVIVESNRVGDDRLQLSLRGVGRRGELRPLPGIGGSGTRIQVSMKPSALEGITPLAELVKIYAPTLPHDIVVEVDGTSTTISAGWLQKLPANAFADVVQQAVRKLRETRTMGTDVRRSFSARYVVERYLMADVDYATKLGWPLQPPEYQRGQDRLVGAFPGVSLICLKGLAVQPAFTPGFVGVIDLDQGSPDVNRTHVLDVNLSPIIAKARTEVKSQIVKNLNALTGLVIAKTDFIEECVSCYGSEPLIESEIRWISQLKLPGEVALISAKQFLEKLAESNSLFISYATGPWTALKEWARSYPTGEGNLAIVVDTERSSGLGYVTAKEQRTGSLSDLWSNYTRAPLFATIIGLVADAWKISPPDLISQPTWTHVESHLSGRLSRP